MRACVAAAEELVMKLSYLFSHIISLLDAHASLWGRLDLWSKIHCQLPEALQRPQ